MAIDRKDYAPLILLVVLLMSWPHIDRYLKKNFFPQSAKPAASAPARPDADGTSPAGVPPALTGADEKPAQPTLAVDEAAPAAAAEEEEPAVPETWITLGNDKLKVVLSSRGASLVEATLAEYRATRAPDSGPVVLDFRSQAALAYRDIPGLSAESGFAVEVAQDGRSASFEKTTAGGLQLVRTVRLGDRYQLEVNDQFRNVGTAPLALPGHRMQTGLMRREVGHVDRSGISTLGVDTLSPGGEGVKHWGSQITKLFKAEEEELGATRMPLTIDRAPQDRPVDWVAAKNKYFVQILTPEGGAERALVHARRTATPRELADPTYQPKMTPVEEVAASLGFAAQTLEPGAALARSSQYYVGPKKYAELFALRLHQVDVMEFGFWSPVGKVLLVILNFIHDHLPPHNYGIAIILLTVIVRVVFWPLTHKSTESMRRMAALQPHMQAINEKYKDNPQKKQQELMALYKEHKINPLSGCLPMLVQIPVFIALFVVLRSAIELRFSAFLWIRDLSEPENLLAGVLPIPLNILPLLMSATMYWQQKLTPAAGDPAQQKIMRVMMPIMMLFFLYNFASGLALYWTTQNVLMIVQQVLNNRRKAAEARAPSPARA